MQDKEFVQAIIRGRSVASKTVANCAIIGRILERSQSIITVILDSDRVNDEHEWVLVGGFIELIAVHNFISGITKFNGAEYNSLESFQKRLLLNFNWGFCALNNRISESFF
jgi:hypothetical protein